LLMPILFSTKKLAARNNSLGNLLKNTRLRHKLKLSHIEKYTNIRQSYIVAIENNQWDTLPTLEYAKKFILTYAKFLELDETKIKNRFTIEAKHFFPVSEKNNSTPFFLPKIIITPRTITAISVITIFSIISLFAYYQINHFIETPKLNISQPADYTEVSVNKVEITGQTDPDNIIYINNQPLTTDKNGNFSTPVQLKHGYNIVKVTAENKIGRTTSSTKVIVANLLDQNPHLNQINLLINAKSNIWVRIMTNDQEIIYDGTITTNTSQSFSSDKTLFLSTSNAGATTININNQDLGTLGEDNEIIENLQISNQPDNQVS
ncbi:MAG: RodZ domain-containing protein, partial [Patescibacteria group bacterium]